MLENMFENVMVAGHKVLLVVAIYGRRPEGDCFVELTALAESAGAVVVDKFGQRINRINAATYIGKGKAKQIAERVEQFEADLVVFDNNLSPGQIRTLEEIIDARVIDRSELILDIFASRAQTRQAKLQVTLAQLQYTYPRLTKMWSHLDSVAGAAASGGVGTRGTGEKQLEIDRRLVKKRVAELKAELADIDKRKIREIKSRKETFKVSLVGYTNSGKSSILNKLTKSDVYTKNQLFATLDTRTKKWNLTGGISVLLSDTIGFVQNLPHQLVASFRATLEEAVNADLLLYVIDVSDPKAIQHIEAVNNVLAEIGCKNKDVIMVFNKVDVVVDIKMLKALQKMYPEGICTSAKTAAGLGDLTKAVQKKCQGKNVTLEIVADQANGKLQSFLRACGKISKQTYHENKVVIEIVVGQSQVNKIKSLAGNDDQIEVVD